MSLRPVIRQPSDRLVWRRGAAAIAAWLLSSEVQAGAGRAAAAMAEASPPDGTLSLLAGAVLCALAGALLGRWHVRQQAQSLAAGHAAQQRMLDHSQQLSALFDSEGRLLTCNPAAQPWLQPPTPGVAPVVLWEHPQWIHDPAQSRQLRHAMQRAAEGRASKLNLRLLDVRGALRQFEVGLRPVALPPTPGHRPPGLAVQILIEARDVTMQRQAQDKLLLAAAVFEQAREGIMITDPQGVILSVNRAMCDITGYGHEELEGQSPGMLSLALTTPQIDRRMRDALQRHGHWQGELESRHKSGRGYTAWVSVTRRLDEHGQTSHLIGLVSDITRAKQAEQQLLRLAHFDALTTLPNRHLLIERTRQALIAGRRHQSPVALLFLDLNQFRHVNEHFGHQAGDLALLQVASRLREGLREVDTVARLGGDEFAVLLPSTGSEGAAQVATKLLERLAQPCQVAGHDGQPQDVSLTISIGIALSPEDAQEPEALMRCADTAMYRAKQEGRGHCCFYTSDMQLRTARQMQLEAALRRAESRGELRLHYQPQLDLSTQQVVGLEALVRWQHPELGMISPAEFIPLAESTGQILSLGEWVMRTAVLQMKQWIAAGLPPRVVAVNLSAIQFKDPGLPDLVRSILDEAGLDPACLELELTESVAAGNPAAACAVLDRLHALGVRLSIDDFGTGFSSLNHLKRFPIHTLKIDQTFVRDIVSDADDRAIVEAIIQMAHALRLTTIAEGVETAEQTRFLQSHGCDMVQGYRYCRPQPPEQALAWVRQQDAAQGAPALLAQRPHLPLAAVPPAMPPLPQTAQSRPQAASSGLTEPTVPASTETADTPLAAD